MITYYIKCLTVKIKVQGLMFNVQGSKFYSDMGSRLKVQVVKGVKRA